MQSDVLDAPLILSPEIARGTKRRHRLAVLSGLGALVTIGIVLLVRRAPEPTRYATAIVERRTIIRLVEVTGRLDVVDRVEVPAPIPGRLIKLLARVGDQVTAGAPLALLDGRASAIAARGAQASLDAAASRVTEAAVLVDTAKDVLARTERLRSRELTSESELAAARSGAAKAAAALATARAEQTRALESLRSAQLSQSLSTVTAPTAGIVLQAPDALGASVGVEPGPLFVLGSSLDELRVDADVAESEVGELSPGQSATFSVPAHPGQTFEARVERVGITARRGPGAVRYPVELRAQNRSRALLPDMTATVRIAVARAENVLATRDAALRFHPPDAAEAPPRSRVFRTATADLQEVRVAAGLSDGAFTELRPESPGSLPVGTELALGALAAEPVKTAGPGIRLGKR